LLHSSAKVLGALELAEELVVEVALVGDNDERGVVQSVHDLRRVAAHGDALARAGSVPDDAELGVVVLEGVEGALHRRAHGVELGGRRRAF
jgi:hypothetical protein